MMIRPVHISVLLLSATMLVGCYYDNEEELYPSNFCDVSNVTFSGTIKPLIQSRCAIPGCHVTGAQIPDLSIDANIEQQKDRIQARAIDHQPSPMPPTGPLPNCEIQQLQAWLNAGAPINN